jgi:YfiH family protein
LFRLDNHNVYRAESLEQFPWLDHGFGTRLSDGWPDLSRLATPKQIHSDRVLVVPDGVPTGAAVRIGEGDALIAAHAGILAGIRTADCLPILLVDAVTRAVGAIHAGWRGTVSEISAKAVRAMMCQFGTRQEDIWAAIGPGICSCCFEVGPEVAILFAPMFPERADLHHRARIDLVESNRRQLVDAGVPPSHIECSGLCTSCLQDEFHSYRRDKDGAGRMISAIGIRTV